MSKNRYYVDAFGEKLPTDFYLESCRQEAHIALKKVGFDCDINEIPMNGIFVDNHFLEIALCYAKFDARQRAN